MRLCDLVCSCCCFIIFIPQNGWKECKKQFFIVTSFKFNSRKVLEKKLKKYMQAHAHALSIVQHARMSSFERETCIFSLGSNKNLKAPRKTKVFLLRKLDTIFVSAPRCGTSLLFSVASDKNKVSKSPLIFWCVRKGQKTRENFFWSCTACTN